MCGIFAALSLRGAPPLQYTGNKALDTMAARGPNVLHWLLSNLLLMEKWAICAGTSRIRGKLWFE